MPTYEFRCDACGCKFEVKQGYNDKALVRCPKCKSICKRLISSVPHYWKDGVPN